MLPPFAKIMQNFILMQKNTYKRDFIGGGEILGAPFPKKVPFLASIERCSKFLD